LEISVLVKRFFRFILQIVRTMSLVPFSFLEVLRSSWFSWILLLRLLFRQLSIFKNYKIFLLNLLFHFFLTFRRRSRLFILRNSSLDFSLLLSFLFQFSLVIREVFYILVEFICGFIDLFIDLKFAGSKQISLILCLV
jgi:hypothetical protein